MDSTRDSARNFKLRKLGICPFHYLLRKFSKPFSVSPTHSDRSPAESGIRNLTVLSVVLPFKCSTTSSESGIRKLASPYYIGLAKDRNPESGISSRWSNPKPMHVCGHSGIWNLEFHLVQPKTNALVGTADVLAAAQTRPVRDSAIAVARDRYHRRRPPCCTSAARASACAARPRRRRAAGRSPATRAIDSSSPEAGRPRRRPRGADRTRQRPDRLAIAAGQRVSGFRIPTRGFHVLGTSSVKVVLPQIPEWSFCVYFVRACGGQIPPHDFRRRRAGRTRKMLAHKC